MEALKIRKQEINNEAKAEEGRSKALIVFFFLISISVLSTGFVYISFRDFDTKTILTDALKLGIEIGLYSAIFLGKNWARMLLTALFSIGICICVYFIVVFLLVSQYSILLLLPFVLIYVYVIYFIYGDKDFLKYFESKSRKFN